MTGVTRRFNSDVLVVGAGSSGCIAAIAAARHGVRTVLLDRNNVLGGTSTAALDTFYAFYTSDAEPRQVVRGVGQDVLDALQLRGACFSRQNTFGSGLGVTYNPEVLAIVWDELLQNAGVTVLTGSTLTDATEIPSGGRVEVAAKGGRLTIDASVLIDATGDGDLAFFAGAKPLGDGEFVQPATTTFRLGNVDTETTFPSTGRRPLREYIEEARLTGYDLPGDTGSMHRTVVPSCVLVAMTRVQSPDPDDPESWSRAQRDGRSQIEECVRFLRERVPGFSAAVLVGIATSLGVRETRRIEGVHVLTEEEILEPLVPEDSIALCGAPIEDLAHVPTRWIHIPSPGFYGIPVGCLQPLGLDHTLVTGRCFSATHGAHSSARSMGTCMALGHAAGVLAAHSVALECSVREVPIEVVRDTLRSEGALLELTS